MDKIEICLEDLFLHCNEIEPLKEIDRFCFENFSDDYIPATDEGWFAGIWMVYGLHVDGLSRSQWKVLIDFIESNGWDLTDA